MDDMLALESERSPWWVLVLQGGLNVLVGILLLTSPAKTATVFTWVLGFYWFVGGMLMLVGMFMESAGWGWKLFAGLLSMAAGVAVMRQPVMGAVMLPALLILMLGIQGIVVGVISASLAFVGGGWGAGILGILSILFGGLLVANFANLGTILILIWIAAITAILGGLVQIFQAFRVRRRVAAGGRVSPVGS